MLWPHSETVWCGCVLARKKESEFKINSNGNRMCDWESEVIVRKGSTITTHFLFSASFPFQCRWCVPHQFAYKNIVVLNAIQVVHNYFASINFTCTHRHTNRCNRFRNIYKEFHSKWQRHLYLFMHPRHVINKLHSIYFEFAQFIEWTFAQARIVNKYLYTNYSTILLLFRFPAILSTILWWHFFPFV